MTNHNPARNSSPIFAELVLKTEAVLGEGAIWHQAESKLYWVDIEGKLLHLFNPDTKKDHQIGVGARIGTVVPLESGGALVALQNGIYKINTQSGELSFISQTLSDPNIRFNDGKCDPSGRFWVGTMHLETKEGAAVLYRLDKDQRIEKVLDGLTISNGIVWSADSRTMYFIDTPTSAVQAFDYQNDTGEIKNGREVIHIPPSEGHPDGMTIDEDGNLWIALYGGGGVACYDPDTGEMLQKIKVPVPNTTSCAFGGKNLDTLFITTARDGLSQNQLEQFPLSGSIFAAKPGVKGVKANFCKMVI